MYINIIFFDNNTKSHTRRQKKKIKETPQHKEDHGDSNKKQFHREQWRRGGKSQEGSGQEEGEERDPKGQDPEDHCCRLALPAGCFHPPGERQL